jgi:RNA polymerase sigma-70 factor (ECF subfamily)
MATKTKSLPRKLSLKKAKPAKKKPAKKKPAAPAVRLRRQNDFPWQMSGRQSLLVKNPSAVGTSSKLYRRNADLVRCKDLNDSELVTVTLTQNREAYKELFARYQKKLFVYIFHLTGNRDETEDILQNVFSKTYKNIKNFDTSRKFSSWIYRIAHNEAVNFLKRKSKRYTISWDDITTSKDKLDTASSDELPEDKWARQEIKKDMEQALGSLPEKYQQILKLKYLQEYSYKDIGVILGKPVNTVGTLINRAKKKLLEVVKEQEGKK